MSPRQEDYILRIIEQLGAALRRIRELLSGEAPAAEEALDEIRAAQTTLFGDRNELLDRLDAATAVSLIPEEPQVIAWIELIRLEAKALHSLGFEGLSEQRELRAARLEDALRESRLAPPA